MARRGGRLGDQSSYMNNSGLPGGGGGGGTNNYVLGSTGGEQQAWGDRSWMWLLFGPIS